MTDPAAAERDGPRTAPDGRAHADASDRLRWGPPPRAVLLDALGTLVELADPFAAFERELAARGVEVTDAEARAALSAEMRHYRRHCHTASDAAALSELRDGCTAVLRAALPVRARGLAHDDLRAALLDALRFRPFPDVPPALERWRAAGSRLAVVSNWDVSLHDVLVATGLARHFDAVVTSAEAGSSKPGAAVFRRALDALGVGPADAAHVGDTPEEDVAGARAAGLAAVLVQRGELLAAAGVPVVRSLDELWVQRAP